MHGALSTGSAARPFVRSCVSEPFLPQPTPTAGQKWRVKENQMRFGTDDGVCMCEKLHSPIDY